MRNFIFLFSFLVITCIMALHSRLYNCTPKEYYYTPKSLNKSKDIKDDNYSYVDLIDDIHKNETLNNPDMYILSNEEGKNGEYVDDKKKEKESLMNYILETLENKQNILLLYPDEFFDF